MSWPRGLADMKRITFLYEKIQSKEIGDAEFLSSAGGPHAVAKRAPLPGGRTEMMPKLRRTMWLRLHTHDFSSTRGHAFGRSLQLMPTNS